MEALFLIGRIIFGGFFAFNGLNHFMKLKMMSGYAKSKGVTAPTLAVPFTGLLLLVGGLTMIAGRFVLLGEICLIIFLLPVSMVMHNYWKIDDPMMKMGERVNFMKNMALLGAVFMIMAFPQPWPLCL